MPRKKTTIERFDAEILQAVKRGGPILLWVGDSFPGGPHRGLNLSFGALSRWLGIQDMEKARKGGSDAR